MFRLLYLPLIVQSLSAAAFPTRVITPSHLNKFTTSSILPTRVKTKNHALFANSNEELMQTTASVTPSTKTMNVWLRFSPLVGGPPFLPLHVEVILKQSSQETLHRFDFLPMNPLDPSTIKNLITLRSVPGNVRYRCYNTNADTAKINGNHQGDDSKEYIALDSKRRNRLSFPIGFINDDESTIINSAMVFCDKYKDSKCNLHLIRNNCYNFAWDFLRSSDVKYNMSLSRTR